MGLFLCPRCLIIKSQVPRIGTKSDEKIRHLLRDYANDSAARIEFARKIVFDSGMSLGGKLEILKKGSLVPTRVTVSSPYRDFPSHSPIPERISH